MSSNKRIFIGNLSHRTTKKDLIQNFEAFGEILKCDLKDKFAFIEYDNEDACKDAIYKMHHVDLNGRSIAVEMSHSRGPRRMGRRDFGAPRGSFRESFEGHRRDRYDGRHSHNDKRNDRDDRRGQERGRRDDRRRGSQREYDSRDHYRSNHRNYRVKVSNLSSRVSWQDLKDFAREQVGASVVRTDVWSKGDQGYGLIEFTDRGDYDYALDHLSGKTVEGEAIEVSRYRSESAGRGRPSPRYNSRSSSRGRSRSRSRRRRRSRSSSASSRGRSSPSRERNKSQLRSRNSRSRSLSKKSPLSERRSMVNGDEKAMQIAKNKKYVDAEIELNKEEKYEYTDKQNKVSDGEKAENKNESKENHESDKDIKEKDQGENTVDDYDVQEQRDEDNNIDGVKYDMEGKYVEGGKDIDGEVAEENFYEKENEDEKNDEEINDFKRKREGEEDGVFSGEDNKTIKKAKQEVIDGGEVDEKED